MTHTEQAILDIPQQFAFKAHIENESQLASKNKYLVVGMGGSHLAADVLKSFEPHLDIVVHIDYGIPILPDLPERLVIAFSYSGNTEEVLQAYQEAREQKLALAVISRGGALGDLAQKDTVPFVRLPETGIQARMALGVSLRALAKLMGQQQLLAELGSLTGVLKPERFRERGRALAEELKGHVPVVYASRRNTSLACNWKIKFNESSKIPAFFNTFSELNHNEMAGFDVIPATAELSRLFHVVLIRDADDSPRMLKRMEVLERLYKDRELPVSVIDVEGNSIWERVFNSLLLAEWTAYHLSLHYGTEPEAVAMVEEFKKLIA